MEELKEIHNQVPDIGLEWFVHGSICIAYSGRCLLSNYFNHRDANQGTCTNSCRWEYNVKEELQEGEKVTQSPQGEYLIEEKGRDGEIGRASCRERV